MNPFIRLHRLVGRFDDLLSLWGGLIVGLFLRAYVGWQFFKSGLTKVSDWSSTLMLFQDEYKVPLLPPNVAAYLGTFGELALPALLLVGLFSRPAAAGLFVVNAVAVISYPQLFEAECPAGINDHFYWGVMLLALLAFGPGRLSLDFLLAGKEPPAR